MLAAAPYHPHTFSLVADCMANNTQLTSRGSYAATQNLKPETGSDILVQQRLKRPVSPHLGIYKWQITWLPSILNRITGSVLSGGLYVFGFGYLVAPLLGMHWESHAIAAAFGSLPLLAKVGLKFTFAFPFTFHSINGVRHLVWDMGKELRNSQIIWTGWTVIGLSLVSAAALAAL